MESDEQDLLEVDFMSISVCQPGKSSLLDQSIMNIKDFIFIFGPPAYRVTELTNSIITVVLGLPLDFFLCAY